MDGSCDHEGGGPGRLPEHLSGHHVRNGTCGGADVVQLQPKQLRRADTPRSDLLCVSLHVWPRPNNTSANGGSCYNQWVCVNDHWWRGQTHWDLWHVL